MTAFERFPTARAMLEGGQARLPDGVRLLPLAMHHDARGTFTELFRDEWHLGPHPVQWNFVRSAGNVMRGVHAHRNHFDYVTMADGEMVLGLKDVRRASPTAGASVLLRLRADDLHLVVIPTGVAHGFYYASAACHIYAVTHVHDAADEFGCHWADPELGLPWGIEEPELSGRDRLAGSFAAMIDALENA